MHPEKILWSAVRLDAASAQRPLEAVVGLQLVLAAGLLEIALRRARFPRLVAWVRRAAPARGGWFPIGRRRLRLARVVRLAALAARVWRGDDACLPRALLELWLRLGVQEDAALVVGVRRAADDPFRAHAWVEVGGQPSAEDAALGYTTLARY